MRRGRRPHPTTLPRNISASLRLCVKKNHPQDLAVGTAFHRRPLRPRSPMERRPYLETSITYQINSISRKNCKLPKGPSPFVERKSRSLWPRNAKYDIICAVASERNKAMPIAMIMDEVRSRPVEERAVFADAILQTLNPVDDSLQLSVSG